jgi:hypothetical protein
VDHVFTLHAELEGMQLLSQFENLILGWKEQGYQLVTTRDLLMAQAKSPLPYFQVKNGTVPGRSGELLVCGSPYPSALPG